MNDRVDMRLKAVLKRSDMSHLRQTGWWLFWTIFGSFMPIWLGMLALLVVGRHFGLSDFGRHGEFAIYAAAILAPAFYMVLREQKHEFVLRQTFIAASLIGIVVAACVYILTALDLNFVDREESVVITVSMLLLIYALVLSVAVVFLDRVQDQQPNVGRLQEKDQRRLASEVTDLVRGDQSNV